MEEAINNLCERANIFFSAESHLLDKLNKVLKNPNPMGKHHDLDDVKECKLFLEKVLNTKDIPMYSQESIKYIDNIIAHYITEANHEEWLINDGSIMLQLNGTYEKVLSEFVKEGKIFTGTTGKYQLFEVQRNNTKYFQAWPLEPSKFSFLKYKN